MATFARYDMSSSDLTLTFLDVYTRVSDFLGLGTSPTGADLTKVKDIVYRGYRRFLLPMNLRVMRHHVWSFLRQTGQITTVTGQWQYALPLDFNYFWMEPTWGDNTRYVNPDPTSMARIMQMRAADKSNAHPFYWSLNTQKFTVTAGTQYEMVLHSPPDGEYTLVYGYTFEPDKPTDDGHYFIGGACASEAILEYSLAVAEEQEDDKQSVHDGRAKELTQGLIERDLKLVPTKLGKNLDRVTGLDNPSLARQLRYIGGPSTVYGVS